MPALSRGDFRTYGTLVDALLPYRADDEGMAWHLARAGRRQALQALVRAADDPRAPRMSGDVTRFQDLYPRTGLARGELAHLDGRHAEAVSLLRRAIERIPLTSGVWWQARETLADSLAKSGDVRGAIQVLEEAQGPLMAANAAPAGSESYWTLRVQDQLAVLYRQAGRAADAERLERRLLALLAHADEDFVIARRLRASRGRPAVDARGMPRVKS